MTIEKQIEEMVKIMNECCNVYDEQGRHIRNKCYECEEWSDDNHCCCSYNTKEAAALYNAGYRKASEIAREIFEEIESCLWSETQYGDSKLCFEINSAKYAELKKKYTEEDEGK